MALGNDPLAAFRKPHSAPPEAVNQSMGIEDYAAFGTKNDAFCVEIRSAEDVADSPGYNILLTIHHDRKLGTTFTLLFSIMVVQVRGKNLRPVVFALQNRKAEFIEKFDPSRWSKPTDPNAPIIDSIEIRLIEDSLSNSGKHN